MLSISLSPRLSAVADYIRFRSVAADIGTDHGQLICWLAQSGVIEKGYACDVNYYPLERSAQLIQTLGLQDKVEVVLTNGLYNLHDKNITDFAIAGMGGELISNILADAPWIKNPDYNLVLQPMSRDYKLRQYLAANGFKIINETAVASGKFTYTVMQVVYTGTAVQISYHYAWSGEIWYKNDSSSIGYLKNRLLILEQMQPALKKDSDYINLIQQWRERINNV